MQLQKGNPRTKEKITFAHTMDIRKLKVQKQKHIASALILNPYIGTSEEGIRASIVKFTQLFEVFKSA